MANEFARRLRKGMTDAERFVWARIRHRQILGLKFRRQDPVGPYIADFVCHEIKLVLELDGGQHANQIEADAARTRWFEAEGYRVVRFWNNEIFEDWDAVAQRLCESLPPDWSSPSPVEDRTRESQPDIGSP
jgi:very-short-patch-repair endonuclease